MSAKVTLIASLFLVASCASQAAMPTDGGPPLPDGPTTPLPDAPTTPGVDAGGGGGLPDAGTVGPTGPLAGPELGAGPTPASPLPVVTLAGGADCVISQPTTWTAAVYVVQCALQVNQTLTIDQGTIVKFDQNASMTVANQGTIQALGGWRYPIIFTSLRDDASGGDTNGDGAATSPAAGDWLNITIGNGNFGVQVRTSNFQETQILYAGQSDRSALLATTNPTVAVFVAVNLSYSVIAHDQTHTDSLSAPPAVDLRRAVGGKVTNNIFYDNFVPVGVSTNVTIDDTNAFDNRAAAPAAPEANKYNGIVTEGAPFSQTGNVTWATRSVPFIVAPIAIVANGPFPVLAEGVVLKFLPGGFWRLGGGTATSVIFTSIADDARLGDTNGDGDATLPAPGDWSGVVIGANGTFDHCQVSFTGTAIPIGTFGGAYAQAALQIADLSSPNVKVTNSIFAHNHPMKPLKTPTPAVIVTTANAIITGNVFYDNEAPLEINGNSSLDDSNSFDNSAASPGDPEPNDVNGVFVAGALAFAQPTAPIANSIHWSATKVPFVLGNLTIAGTGLLTLGDNVIVKFEKGTSLTIAQGGTLATGNGDIFTSFLDDSHGGDTNGDGSATAPSATDWNGIKQFGACATFMTEFFETCM